MASRQTGGPSSQRGTPAQLVARPARKARPSAKVMAGKGAVTKKSAATSLVVSGKRATAGPSSSEDVEMVDVDMADVGPPAPYSPLLALFTEMMNMVIGYLDAHDIASLLLTCRAMPDLVADTCAWETICRYVFQPPRLLRMGPKDWHEYHRQRLENSRLYVWGPKRPTVLAGSGLEDPFMRRMTLDYRRRTRKANPASADQYRYAPINISTMSQNRVRAVLDDQSPAADPTALGLGRVAQVVSTHGRDLVLVRTVSGQVYCRLHAYTPMVKASGVPDKVRQLCMDRDWAVAVTTAGNVYVLHLDSLDVNKVLGDGPAFVFIQLSLNVNITGRAPASLPPIPPSAVLSVSAQSDIVCVHVDQLGLLMIKPETPANAATCKSTVVRAVSAMVLSTTAWGTEAMEIQDWVLTHKYVIFSTHRQRIYAAPVRFTQLEREPVAMSSVSDCVPLTAVTPEGMVMDQINREIGTWMKAEEADARRRNVLCDGDRLVAQARGRAREMFTRALPRIHRTCVALFSNGRGDIGVVHSAGADTSADRVLVFEEIFVVECVSNAGSGSGRSLSQFVSTTQPEMWPELQGCGVIELAMADMHLVHALTADGKIRVCGDAQYSQARLGFGEHWSVGGLRQDRRPPANVFSQRKQLMRHQAAEDNHKVRVGPEPARSELYMNPVQSLYLLGLIEQGLRSGAVTMEEKLDDIDVYHQGKSWQLTLPGGPDDNNLGTREWVAAASERVGQWVDRVALADRPALPAGKPAPVGVGALLTLPYRSVALTAGSAAIVTVDPEQDRAVRRACVGSTEFQQIQIPAAKVAKNDMDFTNLSSEYMTVTAELVKPVWASDCFPATGDEPAPAWTEVPVQPWTRGAGNPELAMFTNFDDTKPAPVVSPLEKGKSRARSTLKLVKDKLSSTSGGSKAGKAATSAAGLS